MRVVFLRANAINPDPRVEKEMRALMSAGFKCFCIGWDRSCDADSTAVLSVSENDEATAYLIGIASSYGSGAKNAPKVLQFERKLYSWLIENADKYDIVHACDLDTGLAAKAACKMTGKPFVYDIFDFYCDSRIMPELIKGFVRRLEYGVVKHSRATIVCTDQRVEQLKGSSPRQIVVIENTPEFMSIAKKSHGEREGVHLAYVGILTGDRYIDRVLDTVDRHGDLFLEIAGFGPLQDEVARRSKKNRRIKYHGQVPYSETLKIEGEADVMLGLYDPGIANHRMAAPNKYYESLMLGTPLIAVEGTSVADWVSAEQTGVVLPSSFSCEELHAALLRASSENKDCSVTKRQQDLYHCKHSWNLMEKRLQNLYAEIKNDILDGALR